MTTALKVLSYLALGLGISLGVAAPTSQAQASRDYYRLDQIEGDFLRFDADYNRALSGSQAEATADRARRETLSDARREADYVFHRQFEEDYRNTLTRGLRYEGQYRQAQSNSLKETFYSNLAHAAFEGVVVDLYELSKGSRFADLLVPVLALEQGYQNSVSNSLREELYLAAFTGASQITKTALEHEAYRMSNAELYDLERDLGYRYDRTTHKTLQQFYKECLEIIRSSDPGASPRPPRNEIPRAVALRLVGVSNNGTRIDTKGGDLRLLRRDVIRLNAEVLDQYGRALTTPSNLNVEILNESSNLKVRVVGSVIEFTTGEAMADQREAVVLQVQAGSRTFGASTTLKVSVVRPAFRGFDAQLAEKVVRSLYQGILWRDAGWQGDDLATQISSLQRGGLKYLTTRAMDMAKSAEFLANVRGKHTDREILERLYVYILGRDARNPVDSGAYEAALPNIARGNVGQVVSTLVNSSEFMDVVLNP